MNEEATNWAKKNVREMQYGGHNATKTNQQWRANQHERACFGLPSLWSFPSRPGMLLRAALQSWLSLPRSISWRIPPLVSLFCAILQHLELRSSTGRSRYRKLWGRPGDTPSTPFPALPREPRPLRVLRTSRTSAVSCPPCAPQTPRTESASCWLRMNTWTNVQWTLANVVLSIGRVTARGACNNV